MRLFSVAVVTVLAMALLVVAPAPQAFALPPSNRDTSIFPISVIGDSYTNGTDLGGLGPNAWTSRAWNLLTQQGISVAPDVAAEGRAGYGAVGDRGSVFSDLVARSVRPNDVLVVVYGSRNDQNVPPALLTTQVRDTLALVRRTAPQARLLVIGPPWPSASVPPEILRIRDILAGEAAAIRATFMDPITARWFVDQPTLIGSDGVHPTDAGHTYMATLIAPLIADQLVRKI